MFTTNRKAIQTVLNRDTVGYTTIEELTWNKELLSLWGYRITHSFRTRHLCLLGQMISQLFHSQSRPLDLVNLKYNRVPDAIRVSTALVVGS